MLCLPHVAPSTGIIGRQFVSDIIGSVPHIILPFPSSLYVHPPQHPYAPSPPGHKLHPAHESPFYIILTYIYLYLYLYMYTIKFLATYLWFCIWIYTISWTISHSFWTITSYTFITRFTFK